MPTFTGTRALVPNASTVSNGISMKGNALFGPVPRSTYVKVRFFVEAMFGRRGAYPPQCMRITEATAIEERAQQRPRPSTTWAYVFGRRRTVENSGRSRPRLDGR